MSEYNKLSGFGDGVFDCTNDILSCIVVGFIPCGAPCLHGYTVKKATGEDSMITPCMLDLLLCCAGAAINRSKIRAVYNIDGNSCVDCILYMCVAPCLICQEYRQTKTKH